MKNFIINLVQKKLLATILISSASVVTTTCIILPNINQQNSSTEQLNNNVNNNAKNISTQSRKSDLSLSEDNKLITLEEIKEQNIPNATIIVKNETSSNAAKIEKDEVKNEEISNEVVKNETSETQIPEVSTNETEEEKETVQESEVKPQVQNEKNEEELSCPKVSEEKKTSLESSKQELQTPEVAKEEDKKEEITENKSEESKNQNASEKEKNKSTESVDKEEKSNSDNDNEALINLVKEAYNKTINLNSITYNQVITGSLRDNITVSYNKYQNRKLIVSEYGQDYLEGTQGGYTSDTHNSSKYNQRWWRKENGSDTWVDKSSIYSGFGVSITRFLKEIKSVTNSSDDGTYVVTLDQNFANGCAEVEFNTPNMFSKDVTILVTINKDNYITNITADFKKDVLNEGKSPVCEKVSMSGFDTTSVNRPEGLEDIVIEPPVYEEGLTATQKANLAQKIQNAYINTRNVSNATYVLNGETVKYDKNKNEAIIENANEITYYKGLEDNYIDHDYVTDQYRQDSWTKAKSSDIWVKNVRKHTTFTPKELYFLNHVFTVNEENVQGNVSTYEIVILKYDANLAYSYAFGVSDRFNDNITITVSITNDNYVKEIHADFGSNKIDLIYSNIGSTQIVKPDGIIEE